MSVAPYSRARRWRLVAAHRDDPLRAELPRGQHGKQSDRAVPDHGDGLAGAGFGCDRGEPAGAEHVGGRQQTRDEIVGGDVGGGDEGAVGQRDVQQLGLRAQGAHRDPVDAGALVAGSADLAGVVGGPERAHYELAGLDGLDLRADLLDDPDVLVAHRCGPRAVADSSVRPEIRPADAGCRHADERVGRLDDPRLLALLDPHVTGPYITAPRISSVPCRSRWWVWWSASVDSGHVPIPPSRSATRERGAVPAGRRRVASAA